MSASRAFSFAERAESIARQDACPYHIHELMLAKMLGFASVGELLVFTDRLAAGGTGGNPKLPSWEPNPSPCVGKTNLRSSLSNNCLHFHAERLGENLSRSSIHKQIHGRLRGTSPSSPLAVPRRVIW